LEAPAPTLWSRAYSNLSGVRRLRRAEEEVQLSRRVYRSRSQLVFGVVIAVIFDALAVGVVLEHPSRTRTLIVGGLLVLAITYVSFRVAAAAVIASDSGIRVRNVFSSFDLDWDEIVRFDIGRWKLLPYVCLIHLSDGRLRHAFGIEESTNVPNEAAKRTAGELNQELTDRRLGGSEAQPTAPSSGGAQEEHFRALDRK
jgi:hypothetical protein